MTEKASQLPAAEKSLAFRVAGIGRGLITVGAVLFLLGAVQLCFVSGQDIPLLMLDEPDLVLRKPVSVDVNTERPRIKLKASKASQKLGSPGSHTLFIDLKPRRSAIYLKGRLLGETPFAGQINCRENEIITIKIVPKLRNMPFEKQFRCTGSTIKLTR